MTFDGFFTKAISEELKNQLSNGKIAKIHQPNKFELVMQIRSNRENYKLLISSHPSYARVHITEENYDNPMEPPMFCMLLRKHLEGGVILDIEQPSLERMLIFKITSKNEIGDITHKQLIVEIMGRHSNIILIDEDRNIILDSIKHISTSMNRHRSILPGSIYVTPPAQNKVNPLTATEDDLLKRIDFNAGKMDQQLVEQFSGLSPLCAKEIIHKAGLINRSSLSKAFFAVISLIQEKKYSPVMISTKDKENFYIMPLTHLKGEIKTFSSFSELLDRFYFGKAERDRVKQQANDLERFIKNELEKNKKKIKKLNISKKEAEGANQYKILGELVTANIYMISKGERSVEVINYYDENSEVVKIDLNPLKTPSENAQSYFKKYQKLKNAKVIIEEQLLKTEEEINYFETLMQQMESASIKDIEEIREELAEEGYLKQRKTSKKKKQLKVQLDTYLSTDGFEILAGKNNKQNEYLTMKQAKKDFIWFHTKDIPGSHVVIQSDQPSNTAILEAAQIAAYFSKAKNSSQVPVDYTKIRHVKKPTGAKPGFVIYEQQTTVYVTPDPDLILKLAKKK